ncbi:MarR family winged helix-turn-helix transcriptional regulator [Ferrovibrio sp.]|uniref:MarR family winged helix-turn-helix transcriptional regulator n=1 Tax=Ferrovibrio sp. TaxID=1917215 RepID=UPI0035B450CD
MTIRRSGRPIPDRDTRTAPRGATGNDNDRAAPPFIGARLRYSWQRVRQKIKDDIAAAGFTDVTEPMFLVFHYPLPDAMRPADLARRLGMTRQATNYLIQQMEVLGYLERRVAKGDTGGRRLIHLTRRGWQVVEVIFASLRDSQAQLARRVGEKRFADFMAVLEVLSAEELVRLEPARAGGGKKNSISTA